MKRLWATVITSYHFKKETQQNVVILAKFNPKTKMLRTQPEIFYCLLQIPSDLSVQYLCIPLMQM